MHKPTTPGYSRNVSVMKTGMSYQMNRLHFFFLLSMIIQFLDYLIGHVDASLSQRIASGVIGEDAHAGENCHQTQ